MSQDSLRVLLAWDDSGGKLERVSGRTRILTLPRFMSFGGFGSRSRNFRFWLMASLLFENGGVGGWTIGSAARISIGSSSGSGVFSVESGFVWGIGCSSSIICGIPPKGSGFSSETGPSSVVDSGKDPFSN